MIELKKIEPWQKAVDVIASFISEGNFHFTDKGISFKAIDPSQTVLVKFFMEKAVFDSYDVEPTVVGVDIGELSKIMNRALPKDKMLMEVAESELTIILEGELQRKFNLPLIDLNEEDIKISDYKYDVEIEMAGRILKELLKDASLFGTSIVFRVKNGKLIIESRGPSGAMITTSKETKGISVKTNGKDVNCKFSLNYLMNLSKGADLDTPITIKLKSETPMRVSYKIGTSEIEFLIAHMIL